MQEFVVTKFENKEAPLMRVIVLAVDSNWGNENYSCLYRFRVHQE